MIDIEDMIEQLRCAVLVVKFKKVDGEDRTMRCTLDHRIIPQPKECIITSNRVVNEDIVVVWDTDINAWRSFRKDSVYYYGA